jgi:heme a synthase
LYFWGEFLIMKDNPNKSIIIWLLTGCVLIFLMVVIGGITRLTNSGLSMVDWKLIMGMIPPIGEEQWLSAFEKYKQFPEYEQVNFTFSLSEFKSIFFWEYLHRLIGRLIGLVFIIPFVYFLIKKKLSKKLLIQCFLILFMGAFQGFLGWWMVKSGLVNDPDVSHYRLAIHLLTAFLTFAYTLWVSLTLLYPVNKKDVYGKVRVWLYILFGMVVLQIVYGAFVAGLNAGFIMNTYPKMGEQWISDSVTAMKPIWTNFLEGIGGVQFVHRVLAHLVVLLILYIYLKASKLSLNKIQLKGLKALLIIVFSQFLLGVFTLLYAVPLWLGVAHQIGAFFLLGAVVFTMSSFRKS